jgi:hypothetical protein
MLLSKLVIELNQQIKYSSHFPNTCEISEIYIPCEHTKMAFLTYVYWI